MCFPLYQWEFKCLVHVNTKQHISSLPTLSPWDFITHLSVAPHDSRTHTGKDGGKRGGHTQAHTQFSKTIFVVGVWISLLDFSLLF